MSETKLSGPCGSPVAYESSDRPNIIHLQLGLFDDLEPLRPGDHSFFNEKPSWLHAAEHLPQSGCSGDKPD